MYSWDLATNRITPGQFVKARADVLAISPDGKYVVYFADAKHKIDQAYIGISHVPFFTSHALFKQFTCGTRAARFVSNDRLELCTEHFDATWIKGNASVHERIDPGCPFTIARFDAGDGNLDQWPDWAGEHPRNPSEATIRHGSRIFAATNCQIVGCNLPNGERRVIAEFEREAFEPIEPPDWARGW